MKYHLQDAYGNSYKINSTMWKLILKILVSHSLLFLFLLLQIGCVSSNKKIVDADVVIYGGTLAAIASAVQVARMDKSLLLFA